MKYAARAIAGEERAARILTRLALVLALIVAAALPGGYFSLKYASHVEQVEFKAAAKADALTSLVAANPGMWRYQVQRIEELLQHHLTPLDDDRATVRDAAGAVLLVMGSVPATPILSRSAPIHDSGRVLGAVEIAHSARDLAVGTLLAGALGVLLGGLVFGTLMVLPLRALRRVSAELARERNELAANEERFRRLNELNVDWIWERDADRRLTYVSPSYFELTGGKLEDVLGKSPDEFSFGANGDAHPDNYDALLRANQAFRDFEYARLDPDGQTRWRSISGEPQYDGDGRLTGYRGTGKNVTERRSREEDLLRQASFDALTGLPNRNLLRDRLGHAIERSGRSGHPVALMMLDLDDFKIINDTLGHEFGDEVLCLFAERLLACVRPEDTVARLAGDEFVVLVAELGGEDQAQELASRIVESVGGAVEIRGRELLLSASVGVTIHPRDGADAAILLRNADAAMYQAKKRGGNAIHFFTPELNERAARYVAVRTEMHHALERAEFDLYFQPIVSCGDGRIVGAEALIRWRRADGAFVLPADFIDVAEDTGLIVPIGAWVLRTACTQAKAWQAAGYDTFPISVNLSARQFRHGDLVELVCETLAESGLAPEWLTLEITESTMMSDLLVSIATLKRIEAIGVEIAIDDFGTGYSSLAYLKQFPVRELKIDRSFVRDAVTSPDDATIVRAVIDLAHALDVRVVAEGVESDEHVALLREFGCDWMQGFRLGRPMPASEFETLLAAGPLLWVGENGGRAKATDDEEQISFCLI